MVPPRSPTPRSRPAHARARVVGHNLVPGPSADGARPSGDDAVASALEPVLKVARELTNAEAAVVVLTPSATGRPMSLVSSDSQRSGEAAIAAAQEHLKHLTSSGATRRPGRAGGSIFAELRSGDEMLGVLGLFGGPARSSSRRREEAVQALAHLTVLTLENAVFLEAAWSQTAKLGSAYKAAVGPSSHDSLSATLEGLVESLAQLTYVRGAALYLPASGEDGWRLNERRGRGVLSFPERLRRDALTDDGDHMFLPSAAGDGDNQKRGGIWVLPLTWGDEETGALAMELRRPLEEIPPRQIQMAKLLAAQAANALGVSSFLETERKARKLAEALQEASQAIDRELEIGEVLDRILEQVLHAFPCDAANFMSYEGDVSRVIRSRGYERFGFTSEDMYRFSLEAPRYDNLRRLIAGEAVTVPDTLKDPNWVYRPGLEWLRSWAGVPVRYGEEILGFVMLDSATPGAFDASSSRRLMAFASHAAAAMHNARLYQRLREEHERLEQVNAIGRHFAGSLSTGEIVDALLYATLGAVGGALGLAYRSGESDAPMSLLSRFPPGSSYLELQASPLNETLWREVEATRLPVLRSLPGQGEAMSAIAFPLASGDQMWGVVILWIRGAISGGETLYQVFAAVGQQAGLALSNAVEHAKVQRRLAEMTLLQRVVAGIARRLEVGAVLGVLTERLQASLGFPVVQVYMRDGDEYVLRHLSGPRPVIDRAPVTRGIVGRVIRTGEPSFVPDVRKDPDYVAGLVGTQAEITVPITIDGVTIGALNVETSEPAQLDDDAFELLVLLGDQVSIALQNASLFEAAQVNVENLEARVRERTAQLEAVLEQAVAAERVKAQFVADVSHELRTPLTNIGLYLELLELSEDTRRAEYMATLRRETDRLGRLIEQLLAMSHLDTGQVQLRPQPTDLNSLLQVLIGDRARMIARRGLHLELNPQPNLPPVQADPQYIMQVLTNLLSNATNYTPQGGRITLETGTQERDGQTWVTFTVRDTGPGIPDDELSHIFDRFYRGAHARSAGVSGTGLGLPISREIVERHGGRITLETAVGEGTAFTVWLPQASEREPAPQV